MPHDRHAPKRRILSVGQRVFDRFYLKRALGEGGTGVVWLAHDRVLEQEVALKFLAEHLLHDRKAVERLKHETRRNHKLSHPNIVRIHDFLQDAKGAAIMMEFVEGWSLWTMKVDRPNQVFPVADITAWLRQLLEALDYAHHQAGIVHRDIKPGNLLVNGRGELKITDFGMARNLRISGGRDFVDSRVVGTELYMSPQQWSGHEPTVADDIYSIGATLYELLTGKPPFYQGDIMAQVYEQPPASMQQRLNEWGLNQVEIPAAYEEVVAACLAKHPEDRPGSVKVVAARLGLLDAHSPPDSSAAAEATAETISQNLPPTETEPELVLDSGLDPAPAPVQDKESPPKEHFFAFDYWSMIAGFLLAVVMGLIYREVAAGVSKRISTSTLAARAPGRWPQIDQAWQNSLGMKFIPVPGVPGLFCIWETRVKDFTAFVAELGREPGTNMISLNTNGAWVSQGRSWRDPEFPQTPDHPVVGVSWSDAIRFCEWLTTRERAAGWIATNQSYRLPTSSEWLKAAGAKTFAWGEAWPPLKAAGNFSGAETHRRFPGMPYISGYDDGFAGTAPVGSFEPSALGLYDLAGNVSEICMNRDLNDRQRRRWLAGGSWAAASSTTLSVKTFGHIQESARQSDCGFRVILDLQTRPKIVVED